MVPRATCALLFGVLALAGCGARGLDQPTTDKDDGAASRAHALWLDRTAYVGDDSRVIALAGDADVGPAGTYTLAAQTDAVPYGLTIAYRNLDKPFDTVDFTPQATLLLGTVANLDRVHVTLGASTYSLTAAEASTKLGYDVKALGRDEGRLTDFVRSLQD